MKKLFLTLAFLVTLAVAPAAGAEGDASDAVVAAVEAKYGAVRTIRAEFVQTTKSAVLGDETQKGYVVLQRPNKMRWAFEGGEREFVSDGSSMWMYSKPDNQVLKYPGAGASLTSMLSSFDAIHEQFGVRLVEKTDAQTVLELTPKTDGGVKRVTVVLGPDSVVKKLILVDPFDTVTEVELTNLQLDVDVPEATFVFTPPAGAEVIEAGGM